jgi:hypothetical protein
MLFEEDLLDLILTNFKKKLNQCLQIKNIWIQRRSNIKIQK